MLAIVILVAMVANLEASAHIKLYATIGAGTDAGSTFVELDPVTGAVSTIGPVGHIVNGMAYDATTGTLYGSTSYNDTAHTGLITIDPTTGAGAVAGANGWGLNLGSSIVGEFGAVTNITVNSAGDMFGWWDPSQDDLVSIDKSTGIATRVGDSGLSTGRNGLSFDNEDNLFMVNSGGLTYSVDPSTGATGLLGSLGRIAKHGDFGPDGLYYGLGSFDSTLVIADLSTFEFSTVGTDQNLHTLAFVGEDPEPEVIPEPSTVTIWAALSGLGLLVARRRRKE
jgi:MYXO-CTERM domain-containing protein